MKTKIANNKLNSKTVLQWIASNNVCLGLVVSFAVLHVFTQSNPELFRTLASMDLQYLNEEYYRWVTAEWIHYDNGHLFFNSLALISVGSLLTPVIGKGKTLVIFLLTATAADTIFSLVIQHPEIVYIGGSSGGIFGLMGVLAVCHLRFPQKFDVKWYRPDVLITAVYFVMAQNSPDNFLTHTFGFVSGIVLGYIMIVSGLIKNCKDKN